MSLGKKTKKSNSTMSVEARLRNLFSRVDGLEDRFERHDEDEPEQRKVFIIYTKI